MSDADLLQLLVVGLGHDGLGRTALDTALRAAGVRARIDEEQGAAPAEARLLGGHYQCVVFDESTTGEQAATWVRRLRDRGVSSAILAVTAGSAAGASLVAAGATDYLPRPELTPARLVRRMLNAIRVELAEQRARASARAAAAERRLLEAVLQQLPAAVLIASAAGPSLVFVNDQASELLGRPLEIGGSLEQLSEWPIARALREGVAVPAQEIGWVASDGREVLLRAAAVPVYGESGPDAPLAAVMTLEDLTDDRRVRAELERAVRAREEILALVSHDLRSPLNAISVAVEDLADPGLAPAERRSYVAAVKRSLARSSRLISDLLDASRIEAGHFTVDPRPLDAGALLEQATREHRGLAERAGVRLELRVAPELPLLHGDRDRLLQAIGNLLANALGHGRAGGEVTLSASPAAGADRVVVRVADRGPGIAAEALEHLFDRYWQAHAERRGGAGLGLAIARGIVEAHGGRISAANREDGGAVFTVELRTCDSNG